jgi:hypothetical protein
MVGKRKNEKQIAFVHSVQKSAMANNAPLKGFSLVSAHG